jgi:hypothetical protein
LRHGADGSEVTTPSNGLFGIALARLVNRARGRPFALHVAAINVRSRAAARLMPETGERGPALFRPRFRSVSGGAESMGKELPWRDGQLPA